MGWPQRKPGGTKVLESNLRNPTISLSIIFTAPSTHSVYLFKNKRLGNGTNFAPPKVAATLIGVDFFEALMGEEDEKATGND